MADLTHPETITMYSANWCGDCRRSKRLLDARGANYDLIDLTQTPERATDAESISGKKSIPVIVFPDGDYLVEPTDVALANKLDAIGL